jgi:hypothetical protein
MNEDGTIVIDRHLYLTEDRTRVVEENDPASRLGADPFQGRLSWGFAGPGVCGVAAFLPWR